MVFEIFCMALIGLFVGMAVCFNGYRWFLVLLPILGFFFGFGLGAQTVTALFGVGFLSTVTSWVVGFIVAVVFAVLSYLFYFVGVLIVAGSLGYALGVGLMGLFSMDLTLITWLVGIALGVVAILITVFLNLQKWVIIIATSVLGAGAIIGTFLMVFGVIEPADFGRNAVAAAIGDSFFWLVGFLALAILGIVAQAYNNRTYMLEPYEDRI